MPQRTIMSFKYALQGLLVALKEEPNLRIHFLASGLVVVLGFIFNISLYEWLALVITIGLVITLELTNTAIEEVVDSLTESTHPGAKKAKDVSAAAVLIVSLVAVAVGLIIFLPYLLNLK